MRNIKSFLVFAVILFVSCTKDSVYPPLCPTGECEGGLYVPFMIDGNGYYHVNLVFDTGGMSRFPIFVEADDVDPYYYYNDMGVVMAAFQSDFLAEYDNGYTYPIVQETTIILSNLADEGEFTPNIQGRKWSKRIVGPIPQNTVGDTIVINAEIYWDGGSRSRSKKLKVKIIVE